MQIRIEASVPGVQPDDALRWWSDFGPHDHAPFAGVERRILAEGGGATTMEDRTRLLGLPVFVERVTAARDGDRVRFEGENTLSTFSGAYVFAPTGDGTRVELEARVTAKGWLARLEPLGRPLVETLLRADLRLHLRQLRRDLHPVETARAP